MEHGAWSVARGAWRSGFEICNWSLHTAAVGERFRWTAVNGPVSGRYKPGIGSFRVEMRATARHAHGWCLEPQPMAGEA
jgi:hypothetical protein